MKLKELSLDERPREKLLCKGAEALSNTELLAIMLRSGVGSKNVLDLSREVLKLADNSLVKLSGVVAEKLRAVYGIGPDKATTILALFEIARRFYSEKSPITNVSITSPKMIYDIMIPRLKGIDHEECWVIFLNRANYIISKEMVSYGGMDSTVIDNKVILRMILEKKASGIILIHNHPSGNPRPGKNDIVQTESLKQALEHIDASLLDHIVICDNSYFSFSDNCTSCV